MISDQEYLEANQRAANRPGPLATSARYDRRIGRVLVELDTGYAIAFAPHLAQGLENAKPAQLDEIEVSPSGLGLYFPKLDADLYMPSILQGIFGSKNWTAARMGAEGGAKKSAAKAAAAKENGKKGGRPRVPVA
jgi:hypothetical protein